MGAMAWKKLDVMACPRTCVDTAGERRRELSSFIRLCKHRRVDGCPFSWHIRGVPSSEPSVLSETAAAPGALANPDSRFLKAVVGTVAATVFVILFGAIVRI